MRKIGLLVFTLLAFSQQACTNNDLPAIVGSSSSGGNTLGGKVSQCKTVTYQDPYAAYYSTRSSKTIPYSWKASNSSATRYATSEVCNTAVPALTIGTGTGLTITGKAQYEDRTYGQTGFTGTALKPIRYGVVQALVNDVVVEESTTAIDGTYTLTVSGYTDGTVTVRVLAKLGGVYAGNVVDDSDTTNTGIIYSVTRSDLPDTISAGDAVTADICTATNTAGPAFNILDNIVDAQYVSSTLSTLSKTAEAITAHWYEGSKNGTYYLSDDTGLVHNIYILGHVTDTDQYDDSVILHEMGHYIAEVYSRDDSSGGTHTFNGHYDIRLTWSEGWATFFQSLIKDMTSQDYPEYYVDTALSTMAIEIETPSYETYATGPDNELGVAAMLWDVYDTETTGTTLNDKDSLSDGGLNIWSVFETDLPLVEMVSFEDFYDGWVAGAERTHDQLKPILVERGVNYEADTYESDGTVATATSIAPCSTQTHTYFPKADVDYFKVDVTKGLTYVFFTKDQENGADPMLTLYDSDGTTQLDQNDDETTGIYPAPPPISAISWTADATKTVYIASEPYRPVVAGDPATLGDYGTYTFAIDIFQ